MNQMQSAAAIRERTTHAIADPMRLPPPALRAKILGLHVSVYDDLAAVGPLWREFERHAAGSAFQRYDYQAAWQRHIGARNGDRPVIVAVARDRETIAILPLAIRREQWGYRLSWLAQDLCDYLAPLTTESFASIPPAKFAALWRNICAFLQSDARFRHDVVDFRRMPATIGALPNPFTSLSVLPHPSSAHVATLEGDWEKLYRARRSGHARKQDRVKGERLAQAGELCVVSASDKAEIAAILGTLFEQKAQTFRRKGIANTFDRPGHFEFFLDLATRPETAGIVHVSAFTAGDVPIAASLGLEHGGRYSLFLVSFDEAFARFSPGVIHVNALIERACARGLQEFDFLVGEQRLKAGWCDIEIPLYDHLAAASWRGLFPALAMRLFIRAKRKVKQTPVLWRAFQRLRAIAGRA